MTKMSRLIFIHTDFFINKPNCTKGFTSRQAKESGGSGERNTDLSRRESRYLDCEARQIYGCFEMVSPPREQLHYKKNNEA